MADDSVLAHAGHRLCVSASLAAILGHMWVTGVDVLPLGGEGHCRCATFVTCRAWTWEWPLEVAQDNVREFEDPLPVGGGDCLRS